MLLICPIRSKDGTQPDPTCETGTWCSVDAFLGHLALVHADLRPALLERFGKHRLDTGELRDDSLETNKHLLHLELSSPAAFQEDSRIQGYRTPVCGMLRRYYEAIRHPMWRSSPHPIGEANSQKAFRTAWISRGYQGPSDWAPTKSQMLTIARDHYKNGCGNRGRADYWYLCYGEDYIKTPYWWRPTGALNIPEGWNSPADDDHAKRDRSTSGTLLLLACLGNKVWTLRTVTRFRS